MAVPLRFAGRENMLSSGAFPITTLAAAREKRDEAKKLIADGINPAVQKKLDRIVGATAAHNTFDDVAQEYLERQRENGAAQSSLSKNRWLLEDLAAPFARRPIADIRPAEILYVPCYSCTLCSAGHRLLPQTSFMM